MKYECGIPGPKWDLDPKTFKMTYFFNFLTKHSIFVEEKILKFGPDPKDLRLASYKPKSISLCEDMLVNLKFKN